MSTLTEQKNRLTALRQWMKTHNVDAYIVPSSDPHISEYLPDFWKTREWISGFTGSVGTAVITAEFAGLWADSRYWVQAEEELANTGFSLQKLISAQTTHIAWLAEQLAPNSTVAIDGAVLSVALLEQMQKAFQAKNIRIETALDPFAQIWADRPALPCEAISQHDAQFVSQTRQDKLTALRCALKAQHCNAIMLSALDDIAWLTNLRGSDVTYNPVFLAHMLISESDAYLFVDDKKLSAALKTALQQDHITVLPYDAVMTQLAALPANTQLLVDPQKMTTRLIDALPVHCHVHYHINPTTLSKACKTPADIAHVRQAMEEDGAALCEFFAWLESAIANKETVTEIKIDEEITAARRRRPNFVSCSFGTIAAFNAHGALPHYHATPASNATIEKNGLLLIDSGAQYHNGTTDITRVVAIGDVTPEQKRDYTLVLKSNIALSVAKFPEGVPAPMLDAIARAPLWAETMDYGHGTGHGVGYFLNVHEGPQVISYHAPVLPQSTMKVGMISSIEPGLYRPKRWGIRIENLVVTQPVTEATETEFGQFMCFEILTLCPIDMRCIEPLLLTEQEIAWLDAYHQQVYTRLKGKVSGIALAWLENNTRPLKR